ncbi:uncharacterized protein [Apostichopus japonicus]|uniref:uncharacterized protein isoform X3 n=1 Tax=Stichopus japonicus TaxID=307972 RepID=UPI003AB74460
MRISDINNGKRTIMKALFLTVSMELSLLFFPWSFSRDIIHTSQLQLKPPLVTLIPLQRDRPSIVQRLKTNSTVAPVKTEDNTSYPTLTDILPDLQRTSPVITTCVNYGFLNMLYNFLVSIQRINMQANILVICEDKMSFNELSKGNQNITLEYKIVLTHLEVSISDSTDFGSESYVQLVQKRVYYIELLLRHNIDVLYTDNDIVLLEDPFKFMNGKGDLFIQSENPEHTKLCTGFFYMRANNRTCQLTSAWRKALYRDRRGNQRIFNKILLDFRDIIQVNILPTDRFLSGMLLRRLKLPWDNLDPKPVCIHANNLVGHDNKTALLKKHGLWFLPS